MCAPRLRRALPVAADTAATPKRGPGKPSLQIHVHLGKTQCSTVPAEMGCGRPLAGAPAPCSAVCNPANGLLELRAELRPISCPLAGKTAATEPPRRARLTMRLLTAIRLVCILEV